MKKAISLSILLLLLINCGQTGRLLFYANGEHLVKEGLVSKDGWSLTFSKVLVTVDEITASGDGIQAALPGTHTVDLTAGTNESTPVVIGGITAKPGHYNKLSWKVVKAENGYSVVCEGKAVKEDRIIEFAINFTNELFFDCGEYIGDMRKGIVENGGEGDVELTFHFDHIFGSITEPADETMNLEAPGFAPFAAFAEDNRITAVSDGSGIFTINDTPVDSADAMRTLGHTGEGHCECSEL